MIRQRASYYCSEASIDRLVPNVNQESDDLACAPAPERGRRPSVAGAGPFYPAFRGWALAVIATFLAEVANLADGRSGHGPWSIDQGGGAVGDPPAPRCGGASARHRQCARARPLDDPQGRAPGRWPAAATGVAVATPTLARRARGD